MESSSESWDDESSEESLPSDLSSEHSELSSDESEVSDISSEESESSLSSSSSCDLLISLENDEVCCDGRVSGVASCSDHPLEYVTVVMPDGSERGGVGTVAFIYTPRPEDCGQRIPFYARSTNCTEAVAWASIIKVTLDYMLIAGGTTHFEPIAQNIMQFGVRVAVQAKVTLTPRPRVGTGPYQFQFFQVISGTVLIRDETEEFPYPAPGTDGPMDSLSVSPASGGSFLIYAEDQPGPMASPDFWAAMQNAEADVTALDYLQVRCERSVPWRTIGEISWHWFGTVDLTQNPPTVTGGVPSHG